MISTTDERTFATGLRVLQRFGEKTGSRGRFIALYLGLKRMGVELAELDSGDATNAGKIEAFLDVLFTKTSQQPPFVVLTAPFGQSNSPSAPYSTRSGEVAPGHRYATNTWRNNFNIQKGIACPAESAVIKSLLDDPQHRLACPHMQSDPEGQLVCSLRDTAYRGDEHSIWLRMVEGGYQKTLLDHPGVYEDYLNPGGEKIPLFALLAVLYPFAPSGAYPERATVGIPEFADDFHFDVAAVEELFDCDPDGALNAEVLAVGSQSTWETTQKANPPGKEEAIGSELPEPGSAIELNTGVGAEIERGRDLAAHGWGVAYFGNQKGLGYDLTASRSSVIEAYVEVKSSVGFCTPVLTEEEWAAAQRLGDQYVLAVVDFYGSPQQRIRYLRNPAANSDCVPVTTVNYRLPRASFSTLTIDGDLI